MEQTIQLSDREIHYTLTYKSVKNLNLRIRSDGTIFVSAPKRVSQKQVEQFLLSKSTWILKSLETFRRNQQNSNLFLQNTELDERVIPKIFHQVYENFHAQFPKQVSTKPHLTIRTMKSRWGSCNPTRNKITINRHLLKFSEACIYYVVVHEFVHFLHPNHSKDFYTTLERQFPDYRRYRALLKSQNII